MRQRYSDACAWLVLLALLVAVLGCSYIPAPVLSKHSGHAMGDMADAKPAHLGFMHIEHASALANATLQSVPEHAPTFLNAISLIWIATFLAATLFIFKIVFLYFSPDAFVRKRIHTGHLLFSPRSPPVF